MDGGNGFTGATEERRRTESCRSFPTKDTKITKATKTLRPFDWPPKAACRDVSDLTYKPHRCQRRLVSAVADVTAVGVRRTPTIERPSVHLRSSVAPMRPIQIGSAHV